MTDQYTEESFQFWLPAQAVMVKGGEKGADKSGKRWIQGIASTDGTDLQGEIVEQRGIDFSYFLKHGYFNYDHKQDSKFKIGEPTEAKLTKNGLWVKGFLLKNKEVADEVWEHMTSLAASGSTRRMGFSIEGKVLKRNGNVIEKCWIKDIAITPAPVNTHTWAEIAKSLNAQKWDLAKDKDKSADKKEEAEKAVVASGNVMVPESLEGKQKEDRTVKSLLTFQEACEFVKSETGLSDQDAIEAIVEIAYSLIDHKE
jgi:hypothetical protein